MDKFVIRIKKLPDSSTVLPTESPNVESSTVERIVESSSVDINVEYSIVDGNVESSRQKRARTETTCESYIIFDVSMRKPINDYDPQVRDNIRREYVVKGPCQPFSHNFPKTIVDQIGMEMDNRFSESSTELLTCIACLNPKDSFSNFNLSKLLRLTELYPQDFSIYDRMELPEQLHMWISEMRANEVFSTLLNIGDVAKKMVDLGIHTVFQLVYRLIELVLVLPVATATVERAFSAMNIIKTDLRNKMGDDFLTNCLVFYIEKDVFRSIDNEVIIQHFQNMRTRRLDLPPLHP